MTPEIQRQLRAAALKIETRRQGAFIDERMISDLVALILANTEPGDGTETTSQND